MSAKRDTDHLVERQSLMPRIEPANENTPHAAQDMRHPYYLSRETVRCAAEHCSMQGICWLDRRGLCVHHFYTQCFERLSRCNVFPCLDSTEAVSESSNAFLRECVLETANLLQQITNIDHAQRAHLLDIFLWASELAVKRSVHMSGESTNSSQGSLT